MDGLDPSLLVIRVFLMRPNNIIDSNIRHHVAYLEHKFHYPVRLSVL